MSLAAVRCRGCGGSVVAVPGQPLPSCLFCGADAADLIPFDPPETIEPPVGAIGFAVDDAAAQATFRDFAGSSFWYPKDLRNARLELRHLLLPAWAYSGTVETHFAGLVRASTRSGKRPVTGREERRFEQVLVPASQTLTVSELAQLGHFDERALRPFDPARATDPFEVSELTRSAARQLAQSLMERRHAAELTAAHDLLTVRVASVVHDLSGRPVLVPIFIGAYTWRDATYRVLVNGQTGHLVGEAPYDIVKIVLVALGVVALVALLLLGLFAAIG